MNKVKILLATIALAYLGIPVLSRCSLELPVESRLEQPVIDEDFKEDDELSKFRTEMATFLVSLGLLDNTEKYGVKAEEVVREVVTDVYACTYYEGTTPLMAALYLGEDDLAEDILRHTAHVNAANKEGITALLSASSQGSEASVALLLAHQADVEATTITGYSALMLACMRGSEGVVGRLLNAKAGVDGKEITIGETALMLAARVGNDAIVRLLLEHGATVDAGRADDTGSTALFIAAENNQISTAQLLLEFKANPFLKNKQRELALCAARAGGHKDMCVFLVDAMREIEDGCWVFILG